MITKRQSDVLKIIVEEYIKTVKPVGSKSICDTLDCSSATIRNEMQELENKGLLEKTHISSGRVPSDIGYRYYVDNIMEPKKMNGEDVIRLQEIINNKSLVISDVITKSMEIISELTSCASVILGSNTTARLKKVEVIPIDESNIIAIIITNTGYVENKQINISENINLDEIKKTVDLMNTLLIDTPIDDITQKLEFEVKPIIEKYVKQHDAIYNSFYTAFHDFATVNKYQFSGKIGMLNQPEFNDTNKIRQILKKFEDSDMIQSIEEDKNGINVYIGSNSKIDEDITVIKTKYKINETEGTLAVIGPKRMDYEKIVGLLEYIKDNIESED